MTFGLVGLPLVGALEALRRRSRTWGLAVLSLALPLLTVWGLARLARIDAKLPVGEVRLEGRLVDVWEVRGRRQRTVLRVQAPDSLRGYELPLDLPAEGAAPPPPGTLVRCVGALRGVDPAPAFIGERPRWKARNAGEPRRIHLKSALQLEVLGPPKPSWLLRLKQFVWNRWASLSLPDGPAKELWAALTLGRSPVSDDAVGPFLESGTIHTLVVSGLQITLIMGLLEGLLRRTIRRGSTWVALAGGALYAAVVGFSAPVWRGWLMGSAWVLGRHSGWRLPPVLTLHGALILWWIVHPAAGADPGFLLAWFALLGLIWGTEPLAHLVSPLLGRWAFPFAALAAPWFSTLPLLALLHGGVPLWGIVANALVLPLISVLTPLCLVLTLLPLGPLVQGCGHLLNGTSQGLLPPLAHVRALATASLIPWFLLLGGWLALAQAQDRFRRTRAWAVGLVMGSLLLVANGGTGREVSTLIVEAIDVGQGDALLVRLPGARACLVDTGPSPWAARRVVRVLSRRGVRGPVDLLLTHPHGDHVGGWATLARLWPLETVRGPVLPEAEFHWAPFRPERGGPPLEAVRRDDTWTLGEAKVRVHWPPKPLRLPEANATALVCSIRWQAWEAWFMGDVGGVQERDLLDLGDPPPFVGHRLLKPGHHGGRGVCDPTWIAALKPEVALITAGRANAFGFPASETLATLGRAGCQALVVGPAGGWQVTAGGEGWIARPGIPGSGPSESP